MKKRYKIGRVIERRQKPWPLERAELIQKMERQRREETERANAAIAAAEAARQRAREEAFEALGRRMAEEGRLMELTFRRAHEEIARAAAAEVARQVDRMWREISPQEEFKRRVTDAVLTSVKLDVRAHQRDDVNKMVVVTRLRFEPRELAYAVNL